MHQIHAKTPKPEANIHEYFNFHAATWVNYSNKDQANKMSISIKRRVISLEQIKPARYQSFMCRKTEHIITRGPSRKKRGGRKP